MNVLVIVDGGLVETLQASPLVRSLATGLEAARVTVACAPVAAPIAAQMPGVVEALGLEALAPDGVNPGSLLRGWLALRRRRFHAAAVCAIGGAAPTLAFFTGIPRRAGVASGVATLMLTDHVDREGTENRAALWLRLGAALGVPAASTRAEYDPGHGARIAAEQRMLASGFEDGRLMIAVAPGNGFADAVPLVASRSLAWEPERYAHLCNELTRRHGAGVVVLGTADDRLYVDAMLMDVESDTLDLAGEVTSLPEVAAVLERCDLLVCGDSPLLHLAAAVGTPSVGLFGPTSGTVRAPYGPEHRVVQAVDGGAPSLRQIRVDDVLAGIEAAAL
ncbi:MAG TPA: glycosyltransferase family 9 protein [Candidatus Angelobacter sp.]|jgi:ADP-heptose:LPS heptosyltransferase|nr:glycosyltransferase family 9 protein [Candidatus Angelobacter sp.]